MVSITGTIRTDWLGLAVESPDLGSHGGKHGPSGPDSEFPVAATGPLFEGPTDADPP